MDGYMTTLDEAECANLLRGQQIGRIAFNGPDGLTVHPVSCVSDGRVVWILTAEGTQLAALEDGSPVAFQADERDDPTSIGWSVLARGLLRHGDQPGQEVPQPWAPGERQTVRMVEVVRLTGRVVSQEA